MTSNNNVGNDVYRPYAYSISLDCNAKGYIQPSIKVQSDELVQISFNEDGTARSRISIVQIAVHMLDGLVIRLKESGYKVATDILDVPKEQQLEQ